MEYQETLRKKLKEYEKKHGHQSFTETEFLLMVVAEIQKFVDENRPKIGKLEFKSLF